jgi:hypothetical protein
VNHGDLSVLRIMGAVLMILIYWDYFSVH